MGYVTYIGSNSVRDSRGIYMLDLSDEGKLSLRGAVQAYNTGYLALNRAGTRLYAVSEGMAFAGRASGGVMAYDITGGLPRLMNSAPTRGQRPCCLNLSEDGEKLYVSNFFGGSVALFTLAADGSLDRLALLKKEQPAPGHMDGMHCVDALPGGEAGAIYCGTGSVIVYDGETLTEKARYDCPPGGFGPRHLVAGADGRFIYLLMQSPAQVRVLERQGAVYLCRQVISAVGEDCTVDGDAAAIRLTPDGSLLLASVRAADVLAVYRVGQDGLLTVGDYVHLPIVTPRDINLSPDGRFVVTAGQASDQVCVHRIDYTRGTLELTDCLDGIVSPAAVVIKEAD